jgi:hypothetical protein
MDDKGQDPLIMYNNKSSKILVVLGQIWYKIYDF